MPAPRSTVRNPPTAVLKMCRIHARSCAGTGSRLGERAMRHVLKPTALVVLCGLAAGCATAEYAAEERTCYLEWAGKIPPQIAQVLVNRTRSVELPAGSMTCKTAGHTQTCQPGTRLVQVPSPQAPPVRVTHHAAHREVAGA